MLVAIFVRTFNLSLPCNYQEFGKERYMVDCRFRDY